MKLIGWALTRSEIYSIVIFFVLYGLLIPTFADFTYFFLMNVIGISKFWFAMITLITSIASIFGVLIYENWMKETEVRTVILMGCCLLIISGIGDFSFSMRWNSEYLGINDYVWLVLTSIYGGTYAIAFATLPIMALFAKITPRRIEGTMFAFLTGTSNLS